MKTGFELILGILAQHFGKRGSKIIVSLVLMAFGIKNSEIKEKFGMSYDALRKYRTALESGEIESLFIMKGERTKSELEEYSDLIMKDFDLNPPKTLREAQERIIELTGIKRSLNRLRIFLKKKKFRSRAVGFMPAKADPEVQRNFLNDTLMPLIRQAEDGLIELFFLDASHFVMGGFTGRVWSVVRKYVRTASGRKRFNVLGALHFASKKVETVVNDSYITSTQVIEMLEMLKDKYVKPIKIVLDNAAYQRCAFVKEKALTLGIELIFLPTYSPNLNLIERVWKLVKAKVLNSAYYETFENFQSKISSTILNLHIQSADDMANLISSKFHVIDKKDVIG